MPEYRYQARHSTGQVQTGIVSAESATAAATILRNQGHHVLQLVPLQKSGARLGRRLGSILNYC